MSWKELLDTARASNRVAEAGWAWALGTGGLAQGCGLCRVAPPSSHTHTQVNLVVKSWLDLGLRCNGSLLGACPSTLPGHSGAGMNTARRPELLGFWSLMRRNSLAENAS